MGVSLCFIFLWRISISCLLALYEQTVHSNPLIILHSNLMCLDKDFFTLYVLLQSWQVKSSPANIILVKLYTVSRIIRFLTFLLVFFKYYC